MVWRLSKSIAQLEEQIISEYGRIAWLGTKGDSNHSSASDHNGGGITDPNGTIVVRAIDIRHLGGGPDCNKLAKSLMSDSRLKGGGYLIFDGRIWNPSRDSYGVWRTFSGNPHRGHMHVSVSKTKARYDDGSNWDIGGSSSNGYNKGTVTALFCWRGNENEAVELLQIQLKELGYYTGEIDRKYGPKTSDAVLAMRKARGSSAKNGNAYSAWAYSQRDATTSEHYSGNHERCGH